MAKFENEFSSFPTKKITRHDFRNVDDNIATLIQNNSDELAHYIVDAVTFRTWEEEIYNTQIYAKQQQQSIYFDDEEPDCIEGDVWLGGDV